MSINSSVSAAELRQFIEKVERLDEDKAEIQNHIKDVLSEAKAQGFDAKVLRQVVRIRKIDKAKLDEHEELMDMYKHALGMI